MALTNLPERFQNLFTPSAWLAVSCFTLVLGGCGSDEGSSDPLAVGTSGASAGQPAPGPVVCAGPSPKVLMETSFGNIVVQLDGQHTPKTVANFTQYVNDKFYDQTLFHRIIDGFVIQGGGHDLTGTLKPTREPIELEINPARKHVDGTISMARKQEPNSANSQFFICDGSERCGQLDGDYAPFGQTIQGLDVVHRISAVPTRGGQSGEPLETVVLKAAYCIP